MTKICIDFKFDENEIQRYKNKLPCDNDVFLLLIYFIVPIRFSINDIDMFRHTPIRYNGHGDTTITEPEKKYLADGSEIVQNNNSSQWFEIPLLHFVTNGFIEVMKIEQGNIGSYCIPDTSRFIYYEPLGNRVKVHCTMQQSNIAIVEKTLLIGSYKDFVHRVQIFMKDNFHELQSSRLWSLWLDETDENHLMRPLERM